MLLILIGLNDNKKKSDRGCDFKPSNAYTEICSTVSKKKRIIVPKLKYLLVYLYSLNIYRVTQKSGTVKMQHVESSGFLFLSSLLDCNNIINFVGLRLLLRISSTAKIYFKQLFSIKALLQSVTLRALFKRCKQRRLWNPSFQQYQLKLEYSCSNLNQYCFRR